MNASAAEPLAETWDRFRIVAEVKRRGLTLTAIALDAGLFESACRQGLHGTSLSGAEALAAALNIPFRTLFPAPHFYPTWERRTGERNHNGRSNESSGKDRPVESVEATK